MNRLAVAGNEWYESSGGGACAFGSVNGLRLRRSHGLLAVPNYARTGQVMLVNGLEAWIESGSDSILLSVQKYAPDVLTRDERVAIESFSARPWPTWTFRASSGLRIRHEIFVTRGAPLTAICWKLMSAPHPEVTLCVRPFVSGRDRHALQREDPSLHLDIPGFAGDLPAWRTHAGVPEIVACSNAVYSHDLQWYRNFVYDEDRERGLEGVEDLVSPGVFRWNLSSQEAVLLLASGNKGRAGIQWPQDALKSIQAARRREMIRRQAFQLDETREPGHAQGPAVSAKAGRRQCIVEGAVLTE